MNVFNDIDSYVIYNPDGLENRKNYTKTLRATDTRSAFINNRWFVITTEYYDITFPDGRTTTTCDVTKRMVNL